MAQNSCSAKHPICNTDDSLKISIVMNTGLQLFLQYYARFDKLVYSCIIKCFVEGDFVVLLSSIT